MSGERVSVTPILFHQMLKITTMKKLSTFAAATLLFTSAIAQNQIQFVGCQMADYAHPVQTSNGKYVGYFENSQTYDQGRIISQVQ